MHARHPRGSLGQQALASQPDSTQQQQVLIGLCSFGDLAEPERGRDKIEAGLTSS